MLANCCEAPEIVDVALRVGKSVGQTPTDLDVHFWIPLLPKDARVFSMSDCLTTVESPRQPDIDYTFFFVSQVESKHFLLFVV